MTAKHDLPVIGYPGSTKTQDAIRRHFDWPNLNKDVDEFVASCETCCWNKTHRHNLYGLLQSLDIPKRPWLSVLIDHIDQLPKSGPYNAILVVVCRLTKMALFIPTTTHATLQDLATEYIRHVFSKHGVPQNIVSDWGSKFTSAFWQALNTTLGIEQRQSTAYHPQTDG